jgi:hypothetical protein
MYPERLRLRTLRAGPLKTDSQHDADETETIFAKSESPLSHQHVAQRDGNWQIIASQAHRYYEDPAEEKLT